MALLPDEHRWTAGVDFRGHPEHLGGSDVDALDAGFVDAEGPGATLTLGNVWIGGGFVVNPNMPGQQNPSNYNAGLNTIYVENGALITVASLRIGELYFGTGWVDIGGTLDVTGDLSLSDATAGWERARTVNMTVSGFSSEHPAKLEVRGKTIVGEHFGQNPVDLFVGGLAGQVLAEGGLVVGDGGDGTVEVTDHALMYAGSTEIGTDRGGRVTVDNAQFETDHLLIGTESDPSGDRGAAMHIQNAAKVKLDGSGTVRGFGILTLDGADTVMKVVGDLFIAGAGASSLTAATVQITAGMLDMYQPLMALNTLYVNSGRLLLLEGGRVQVPFLHIGPSGDVDGRDGNFINLREIFNNGGTFRGHWDGGQTLNLTSSDNGRWLLSGADVSANDVSGDGTISIDVDQRL
jgi:hypothetical protein